MPDIAQPARDAAEEIVKQLKHVDLCLVTQGGDCRDFKGCKDHATTVLADIIERHMQKITLQELAVFVREREAFIQKEIDAMRWIDCQGELPKEGQAKLIGYEKELEDGCREIEAVMHQYDEG